MKNYLKRFKKGTVNEFSDILVFIIITTVGFVTIGLFVGNYITGFNNTTQKESFVSTITNQNFNNYNSVFDNNILFCLIKEDIKQTGNYEILDSYSTTKDRIIILQNTGIQNQYSKKCSETPTKVFGSSGKNLIIDNKNNTNNFYYGNDFDKYKNSKFKIKFYSGFSLQDYNNYNNFYIIK